MKILDTVSFYAKALFSIINCGCASDLNIHAASAEVLWLPLPNDIDKTKARQDDIPILPMDYSVFSLQEEGGT